MIFEDEYLYGLKNGKGKEYGKGGQILFDGEYYFWKKIKGKNMTLKKIKFWHLKIQKEKKFLFIKKI